MKTFLSISGVAVLMLLVGLAACARGLKVETAALPSTATPEPVSRTFQGLTVHALHTGWVSVKEAHRTLGTADALRIPAILLDQRWTEWMPVYVFALVHPEGVWLVDTGLSEATLDFTDSACDPGNRFVYQNLLRFRFEPAQRVDRQLEALGVRLADVRGVVFTHRHADHTDAFPMLPDGATPYVGAGDWPAHNGALPCRWPSARKPVLVENVGPAFGALPHSTPLSPDGRIRVVPLNGHSPGHLGVMADLGDGRFALFAGDSTFSVEQVASRTIAGISEVPADARRSLDLIAAQLAHAPTFLLPAHDPASLERFGRGAATTITP
ncbi:MAG: MBL fold metallo-hydrolase [Myxococcaceae bacterium]|nr:MBL fold metallo-hydrolase [Myxococcaceae bacterium]